MTSEKGHKKGHENVPFWVIDGFTRTSASSLERMAGTTGLEPATSAVTGQRSNQLNYVPRVGQNRLETLRVVTDLNREPSQCKREPRNYSTASNC